MNCAICSKPVLIGENCISDPPWGVTAHVDCVKNSEDWQWDAKEHRFVKRQEDIESVGNEVVENLRERGLMKDE